MTSGGEPGTPGAIWYGRAGAARLARLALKELKEILRDRRTIITLILMPLLLYPLLSIVFQQFFVTHVGTGAVPEYRLGFVNEAEAAFLNDYLRLGAPVPRPPPTGAEIRPESLKEPVLKTFISPDLEASVREFSIDVGLRMKGPLPAGFDPRQDLDAQIDLVANDASLVGMRALEFISDRIDVSNRRFLRARLQTLGMTQRAVPVRATRVVLEDPRSRGAVSLAAVIPLILILMTITGAVYPAIDLTAGERERGTLEVLVAAPVPRLGLLLAKYTAVVAVAVLTATVNVVTMSITLLATGLGPILFGSDGVSARIVVEVFALVLLFAAFFSAVLLALCSFARSFKEAQAYLVPLMLVSMAPGMVAVLPGIRLSGLLTVTPLINIVLLARDLFDGQVSAMSAAIVVISTGLYALLAIAVSARIFGAESVLYAEHGAWSDLFRRPPNTRPVPTLTSALICLALLFPCSILSNGFVAQAKSLSLSLKMVVVGVASGLLFGGIPLAAAYIGRYGPRTTFRMRWPSPLAILGSFLLGISLWPFLHEILIVEREMGIVSLSDEQLQRAQRLIDQIKELSPILLVAVIGVIPGFFEEIFFRGYLLSALRGQTSARVSVVASSLLFGVFHLFATDALTFERLVPSTLLGLILGTICWTTKSILPGMVLHVSHNSLVILSARYQDVLKTWGMGLEETSHMPWTWLATAGLTSALGATMIWFSSPRSPLPPESLPTPS